MQKIFRLHNTVKGAVGSSETIKIFSREFSCRYVIFFYFTMTDQGQNRSLPVGKIFTIDSADFLLSFDANR